MIRLSVKKPQITLRAEPATLVTTGGKPYEGAYEVTPTVEGVTLPTKSRVMMDDLTVNKIPIFEVGNTSGGNTVYIAAELN